MFETTVHGRWEALKVIKPCGNVRCEASFDNLILDKGIDHMFANTGTGGIFSFGLEFGSGSTPESVTDTDLENIEYELSVSVPEWEAVGDPIIGKKFIINIDEVPSDPVNKSFVIREVGARPSGSDVLFSRTLVRDSEGNPTELEVVSGDRIIATYSVTLMFPDEFKGVASFEIDGETVDVGYTARAIFTDDKWVPSRYVRFSNTTGNGSGCSSVISWGSINNFRSFHSIKVDPYIPGSFTSRATCYLEKNDVVIRHFGFKTDRGGSTSYNGMFFLCSLDDPLPSTPKNISVTVEHSIGRYEP